MVKVTVLYGHPDEPEAFEKYFTQIHTFMALKIPNLARFETTKFFPAADGTKPAWYRMAELYFKDADTLNASFSSQEGKMATDDIPNFSTGGTTIMIGASQEVAA